MGGGSLLERRRGLIKREGIIRERVEETVQSRILNRTKTLTELLIFKLVQMLSHTINDNNKIILIKNDH